MDKGAFHKVSYGLYIVSSRDGDNLNGHISNTVFQVTAEPPKFAVASHKDNLTTKYIEKSGAFSISILEENVDLGFIGPWGFKSGTSINKFKGINYQIGRSGAPIVLDKAIAYIDCMVVESIDTGTHMLFVGLAIEAEVLDGNKKPLTYDYYRDVIKGLSPENSPTYISEEHEKKAPPSEPVKTDKPVRYQCSICGFIYDPEEGDPDGGIPPGTAFEDIPDDWYCPICGVTKADFYPID